MNNIKILKLKHGLSETDATELYNLINEMRSKNFEFYVPHSTCCILLRDIVPQLHSRKRA